MRSSTTFLAAAATLLSFAAATPLERRYETCTAPKQWHVCGDGWAGCCTVSPCKGPSIASNCPDEGSSEPPTATSDPSTPSASADPVPAKPKVDDGWKEYCKEDDSNCNWKATFYHIKNYDDEYATNSTSQLFVWKDSEDSTNLHRDAIGVFKDIPDGVENCTLNWYKAETAFIYGTYESGNLNLSLIDTGDKDFLEAVDGEVNWKNTAKLLEDENKIDSSTLDLANWGRTSGSQRLTNGHRFSCKGKSELAIHFQLLSLGEGAVIVDQVNRTSETNTYVSRAGWFLAYDP